MEGFNVKEVNKIKGPIFVGGSGRSGTSIIGRLLNFHPDLLYFSEPRLFNDPGGVVDLALGKTSLDDFKKKMLDVYREKNNFRINSKGICRCKRCVFIGKCFEVF